MIGNAQYLMSSGYHAINYEKIFLLNNTLFIRLYKIKRYIRNLLNHYIWTSDTKIKLKTNYVFIVICSSPKVNFHLIIEIDNLNKSLLAEFIWVTVDKKILCNVIFKQNNNNFFVF